jgi:AMIN domain
MDDLACALAGCAHRNQARSRARWLLGLILLMLPVTRPAFALGFFDNLKSHSPSLAAGDGNQPGRMPSATRVLDVRTETADKGVRLVVRADGMMAFKPFTLANPWRIVIDITGVHSAIGNLTIPVASKLVNRVRVGQPEAGTVRIVLDTPGLTAYRVDLDGDRLFITIGKFEAITPGKNSLPPPVAAKPAPAIVLSHGMPAAPPTANPKSSAAEPVQRPDNSNDDHTTVSRLLRRVEELETRVHELEDRQPAAAQPVAVAQPTSSPKTEEAAAKTDSTSKQEDSESHAGHGGHDDPPGGRPRLQLQGFADVNYRAINQQGNPNAFALGQLDLFLTSRLSDKFSVLSELIIEAGLDNAFSFEIHRLLLQYYPNDYFNLSIGRYHTAIGYYNTAYHHGQWFQTAATRPFIFAFEGQGGILPLHNVGLSASGRIPSGGLGLRYIAEIGNGRAANSAFGRSVQSSHDENKGKAVNFGLLMRPDWASGLEAGFSVYHDRLTPDGRPRVDQTIMAAHAIFRNSDYEWLNEALLLRHAPAGGPRVFNTPAFYTQLARRFGPTWPYFRYQYLNVPDDDPLYGTIGRRNGPSIGLRYDLSEFAAFKVQYDHTQRRRQKSLDELLLQMAFTF